MTTLTVSAKTDTVSVVVKDSIMIDSLAADTMKVDSLIKKKHTGFFWKSYYFFDRIFSPQRDRRYIDVQDYYNWCAMLQLSTKLEMYQIETDDGDFMIRLAPKPRYRVGPFFGWRFAFLGYNIDLKSIFFSKDDTDFSGSIYSAAFGLDLFYRRIGGSFYIKNLESEGKDYSKLLRDQSFDGVHLGMTRVSFYYVPNFRHYSHQAAYSQTHRQIMSAGSLILGVQYAHNTSSIDCSSLLEKLQQRSPGTTIPQSIITNGREKNDEFSATVGYGYNWVFHKNWILGSEIMGGIGYLLQNDNVKSEEYSGSGLTIDNIRKQFHRHIALNSSLRFALLYNNGPWFTGLQGVGFFYQHGNGVMMTRNVIATIYLMVGCNF